MLICYILKITSYSPFLIEIEKKYFVISKLLIFIHCSVARYTLGPF